MPIFRDRTQEVTYTKNSEKDALLLEQEVLCLVIVTEMDQT